MASIPERGLSPSGCESNYLKQRKKGKYYIVSRIDVSVFMLDVRQ